MWWLTSLIVVISSASQQDGDEIVQLTPEQRQQLEMIESMPLLMETEVSQEEWEKKTPEEKERIMGEH